MKAEVFPEGLQDPVDLGHLLGVPGEGKLHSWKEKELVFACQAQGRSVA